MLVERSVTILIVGFLALASVVNIGDIVHMLVTQGVTP